MNPNITEILNRLEIFVGGLGKAILLELRKELAEQPSPAQLAEADRRAGAAERELATFRDDLARINRVRDKMKDQWGVDHNVSFDVVWADALKLKQQAIAQQQRQPVSVMFTSNETDHPEDRYVKAADIEVKKYPDGTLAVGPAPLPDISPVQQGPLSNNQIMAAVGRHAGGEKTAISERMPLGQQWDEVCELVRKIIAERYSAARHPAQHEPYPGSTDEYEVWVADGCPMPTDPKIEGRTLFSTPQQTPEQHSDDAAVDRFAAAMKDKLAKAREKGRSGWETCPADDLNRMLREHVEKGDPRDVANFAMMLFVRGEKTVAAPVHTVVDNEAKSKEKPAGTPADTGFERGGQLAPVQDQLAAQGLKEGS